jgi:hypothetical protein
MGTLKSMLNTNVYVLVQDVSISISAETTVVISTRLVPLDSF